MATITKCDIYGCDGEAVAKLEMLSDKTTPVKLDVCDGHFAEWKKLMQKFMGHWEPKHDDGK